MSSRRRVRTLALWLIFAGIVAAAMWQNARVRDGNGSNDGAAAGVTLYRGSEGIPLPRISGRTIADGDLDLSELRGQVVVINVWGSWCAPCRAEAPVLAKLSESLAAEGVRFVGIDVRDNPAAAKAFERNYEIVYPSFDDQQGLVLAQFTGILPVGAVPSTLVADRNGVVRARVVGKVDATTLRGLIADAESGT